MNDFIIKRVNSFTFIPEVQSRKQNHALENVKEEIL